MNNTSHQEKNKKGTLYLVATPIGNLEDITLRALRTLKEVDLILAEDTRHARKLLTHYEIHKPCQSYNEHNKEKQEAKIMQKLLTGTNIALISDAGLPVIADPGSKLIESAIKNQIPYTVLPGANAALTALILSGMLEKHFTFLGFLPKKQKNKDALLEEIKNRQDTLIIYEAPHHLLETLKYLQEKLDTKRQIALVKEISKYHEKVERGTITKIIEKYQQEAIKGEYVIIIEGKKAEEKTFTKKEILTTIKEKIKQGKDKKTAIKETALFFKRKKRDIYQMTLTKDD